MFQFLIGNESPPEGSAIDAAPLLIFSLNQLRYALPLERVERVIRAAAVTPLPKGPPIVLGILDLQGRVIPVFNMRRRFSLPERDLLPEDQFIIARGARRTVALAVDEASDVIAGCDVIDPGEGTAYLAGVVRTEGGLVLIHDLDTFLSPDEESSLAAALPQPEE